MKGLNPISGPKREWVIKGLNLIYGLKNEVAFENAVTLKFSRSFINRILILAKAHRLNSGPENQSFWNEERNKAIKACFCSLFLVFEGQKRHFDDVKTLWSRQAHFSSNRFYSPKRVLKSETESRKAVFISCIQSVLTVETKY